MIGSRLLPWRGMACHQLMRPRYGMPFQYLTPSKAERIAYLCESGEVEWSLWTCIKGTLTVVHSSQRFQLFLPAHPCS